MVCAFPGTIHLPDIKARELLRYLGPGILVTVGFIDPDNWAANIAAGSEVRLLCSGW